MTLLLFSRIRGPRLRRAKIFRLQQGDGAKLKRIEQAECLSGINPLSQHHLVSSSARQQSLTHPQYQLGLTT